MAQKEVTDQNNLKWVCVQAYSESGNIKLLEKSRALSGNGKVEVVCTPTGGAQSVRLKLAENWEELSNELLLKEIHSISK